MTSKSLMRFLIIFTIILLLEIPGCVIVFGNDAGQISYFEHERLIKLSEDSFAAPLILVTGIPKNFSQLVLVYFCNLLLLSSAVLITVNTIRYVRTKMSARQ